ncbi:MAG TPA: chromosome segregation ATPase [Cytophagaceae bacterium]
MKNIFLILILTLIFQFANAQKISITEGSETIDKISRTGMFTIIELDDKVVRKAWEKQLKTYGKVESNKDVYTIHVAQLSAVSNKPCRIISKLTSTPKGTKVWWAIDLGDSYVNSSTNNSAYNSAKKILHEFAAQAYRDDINEQIKAAEKALASSVKNQEKEIKEGEDLVKAVEKNKQEKLALENKLVENAKELEQLKKNIEKNKEEQAAAAQDVEKMKKALEVVKQKLNNIN